MVKGKKLGLVGKVILGAGAIASVFTGNAKASELSNGLDPNDVSIQTSSSQLVHHSTPTFFNLSFNPGATPAVDIFYEVVSVKKKIIGELADNMGTKVVNISGRGLATPRFCELSANINEASYMGMFQENNMTDKKVIQKLYDTNDTPDTADDILLGTYDAWNMTESGQKMSLTIRNGTSHRLETSFYHTNKADFNNDGNVDMKDYAMLANDFGKTGNLLTDISGPSGTSDGVVDYHDLKEFSDDWLIE